MKCFLFPTSFRQNGARTSGHLPGLSVAPPCVQREWCFCWRGKKLHTARLEGRTDQQHRAVRCASLGADWIVSGLSKEVLTPGRTQTRKQLTGDDPENNSSNQGHGLLSNCAQFAHVTCFVDFEPALRCVCSASDDLSLWVCLYWNELISLHWPLLTNQCTAEVGRRRCFMTRYNARLSRFDRFDIFIPLQPTSVTRVRH